MSEDEKTGTFPGISPRLAASDGRAREVPLVEPPRSARFTPKTFGRGWGINVARLLRRK